MPACLLSKVALLGQPDVSQPALEIPIQNDYHVILKQTREKLPSTLFSAYSVSEVIANTISKSDATSKGGTMKSQLCWRCISCLPYPSLSWDSNFTGETDNLIRTSWLLLLSCSAPLSIVTDDFLNDKLHNCLVFGVQHHLFLETNLSFVIAEEKALTTESESLQTKKSLITAINPIDGFLDWEEDCCQ